MRPIRLILVAPLFITMFLSGCGTVQSAAQQDCTSVGLRIGTPDYAHALKPVFVRGKWITAIHSCRAQNRVLGLFNYIGLRGLGLTLITLNLSHINYINT